MSCNVLVTGIGGGGVGRQIIKALKLADISVNLYGCDVGTLSFGKHDVDHFFLLPLASDENYLPVLLAKCEEHKINAIFPGSEKELVLLSQHKQQLEEKNIYLPINPDALIQTCFDKFKCNEFLLNNGFNCPKSFVIQTISDIEKIDFFPVVLKPSSGAGGSTNVMIAQDKGELELFANYLLMNGVNIIAQEYLGNPDNEFTVGVLCSEKGELINSIVLKRFLRSGLGYKLSVKNRTKNKDLGDQLMISSGISQGEFVEKSFINEVCEKIAIQLGATSTINIQGRVHNGAFYVFEINPRFSGTTSARAVVGYNEPEILLKERLLDVSTERYFNYKLGAVYRGLEERYVIK